MSGSSAPGSISEDTLELLTLLQWPQIGKARALRVLEAPEARYGLLSAAARIHPRVTEGDRAGALKSAREIEQACKELDIRIIGFSDEGYPDFLRRIPDPPAILYVRGDVAALSERGVAVVGTRRATGVGLEVAHEFAIQLSRAGYAVVSGLANGIDAAAHEGALEGGAPTVAVLAHGLHTVSPGSNRELADRIVEAGGALVGEHPPGVPPRRTEFVNRNRIQSGLSVASVVVESGVEGGAMHEARFAAEHGRPVFTAIGVEASAKAPLDESGGRELIRSLGAAPVRSADELLGAMANVTDPPDPRERSPDQMGLGI